MESTSSKFMLLQARNAGDPVREEEQLAFADRLKVGIDQIYPVDILTEELHPSRLAEVDALLVGGAGEYSVCEPVPGVLRMIEFLGHAVDQSVPTFGSCFGFQSLVMALGGEVIRDEEAAEVGSTTIELLDAAQGDPLFGDLPRHFVAQQGHKDRASRLPSEAVCFAKSEKAPYQALRIQGKPIYATQFHPELTGASNRQRFERYLDHYGHVFGVERAMKMLEEFLPSPEASSLLERFSTALHEGRL